MLSFSDFSYSAATLEGNMFSQISLIVLIVPLLLALPALPQDASNKEDVQPTVLFVCEQGAAKSIIATAHFDQLAKARGLKVRAVARGTNPDPIVSPKVSAGLRSEGLTDNAQKPKLVTDADVSNAKRVITLGCKLPQKAEVTDWNDIPSPGAAYQAASKAIRKHVEALIEELSAAEHNFSKSK